MLLNSGINVLLRFMKEKSRISVNCFNSYAWSNMVKFNSLKPDQIGCLIQALLTSAFWKDHFDGLASQVMVKRSIIKMCLKSIFGADEFKGISFEIRVFSLHRNFYEAVFLKRIAINVNLKFPFRSMVRVLEQELTHCGLVTPYGVRDLGQHRLM